MFSCIRVYKMLSEGVFLMPLESRFQFFFCHLRYFTFVSHLKVKPCTNVENFNLERKPHTNHSVFIVSLTSHHFLVYLLFFFLLQNLERTLCNLWQVRMNKSFINICYSSSPSWFTRRTKQGPKGKRRIV